MRQLLQDFPAEPGAELPIEAATRRRLERVLRLDRGAPLLLADGRGRRLPVRWTGEAFAVAGPVETVAAPEPWLELAVGLVKGERWDWLVEKCVEVGVDRLVPLQLDHCVVRLDAGRAADKVARWQALAAGAFEQCGRATLPEVAAPVDLRGFLATWRGGPVLACDEQHGGLPLAHAVGSASSIAVVVGPEGGLSAAERSVLQAAGATKVSLGPQVLRAETAALAAGVIVRAVARS